MSARADLLDEPQTTWPKVELAEVARIVNGGTPKSKVQEYWGGNVEWLTPKEMGGMADRHIAATERTITETGLAKSSARLAPPNSLILSTRAPIGHLAINDVEMAFNQGCRGIVPSADLHVVFLYYFLLANRQQLNDLGTGTTFKELSATNLKAFRLPLPPLDEQKRIVAVLDQAFAALDHVHDNTKENLGNSTLLFDSWQQSAFSLCRSWPLKPLSRIAENLDRKRIPITKKDRKPGNIPYYGASGVVDHVADHLFDEDLLLISEDGANLLARTYPIAFSITGKSWVNNHAHVLRFDDSDSQEFVRLYLNSISIAPFVSGMAQPKLNQQSLGRIEIPYPPLEERKRVVAKATDILQRVQSSKHAYEHQIASANGLKKSLLARAFAGELI